MQHLDRETHSLNCEGCGEKRSLRRLHGMSPERYAIMAEAFAQEHSGCDELKNAAKARAEIRWRRLTRLMAQARAAA